ncbi:2-amino-4-hydroxy-6-hydroxymethyldihydropteridine diphosphokinase [Cohaesibacter gelatinilyticus]|uniref:2-amino-4-hydroxy-6-hydroxymethyldihydropteridine pyrophosphokinase n=1 Tax=Cohaesibacter gelatinilyticus TaxID=372072 RepID=A0A285NFP0_9HYPH|nr:2-amino-4-hydroxy-6-hydroxymethyldihydropteridine diphosphokinase [Cohaesibacter gelatinilyticus]SNZ08324.1 2-amino-4-hydroxy-6-hydroxymethyldihydropteridinediphosphokinase [Cohaesibacter gelatinilyticus]HAT86712.1 2-amino-4-hydroxy-6-hydroxymethyldihydropteridine diphosphokinase [Hyphomicrobiales bacterium]
MIRAFLSLGGNIGDAAQNIRNAVDRLDEHPNIKLTALSGFYKTPPWGNENQAPFVNACAEVETSLPAEELLVQCLQTEHDMGRERIEHWGPRIIDIDILTYGDERIQQDNLSVPHPYMMERAFVLVPLKDIAPEFTMKGQSIDQALTHLDISDIKRL